MIWRFWSQNSKLRVCLCDLCCANTACAASLRQRRTAAGTAHRSGVRREAASEELSTRIHSPQCRNCHQNLSRKFSENLKKQNPYLILYLKNFKHWIMGCLSYFHAFDVTHWRKQPMGAQLWSRSAAPLKAVAPLIGWPGAPQESDEDPRPIRTHIPGGCGRS